MFEDSVVDLLSSFLGLCIDPLPDESGDLNVVRLSFDV